MHVSPVANLYPYFLVQPDISYATTQNVEVVAFRPYWVKILPHWHMVTVENSCSKCFIHMKSQFREKIWTSHWGIFVSWITQECDNDTPLIIQYLLYYLSIKCSFTGDKFLTLSSECGNGYVPDIVIWLGNFWYLGILVANEIWS